MDEEFATRVDKLERQVTDNKQTMNLLRDDVNVTNRSLQEQTKLVLNLPPHLQRELLVLCEDAVAESQTLLQSLFYTHHHINPGGFWHKN